MNTTDKELSQNICSKMTQIETDLETTLNKIFAQAGDNIKTEKLEKCNQELEKTKQVFKKFRSRYGCFLTRTKN